METSRPGPSGESLDTPRHRALGSASRAAILRLIRREPGLTGAEVAARTGLHPSTVRAHLERLVAAGLLVRARAGGGGPGRPPWRYRAAAAEPAPAPYRALARALLHHLATTGGGSPAAVAAGREWGRGLARAADPADPAAPADPADPADPAETAVTVLRELGFDPRRSPAGDAGRVEVHLHTCPFLELVGEHPDVMCGLHAGVVEGAVHAAGAPRGQAVLEPFAAPTACVVRLPAPPGRRRP